MHPRLHLLLPAALAACAPALAAVPTPALAQGHPAHHAHAQHAASSASRQGTVSFPNSGSPAAQPPFLRGVALQHNFSGTDAAAAFREAQRADPGFALAYWMEAYAHRDPLGRDEDLPGARAALERLGPTPDARLARARTPRERAWGAAVEALFADGGDADTRNAAFADSMRALVRADPGDPEAATVAAFALLTAAPRLSRPMGRSAVTEAIALAERVFAESADHPGAAHAIIHAYERRSRLAPRALAAARAYARIAPDNVHALHMPSHTFIQLGLWKEVEASNRASFGLSLREGRPATNYDIHSVYWLHFALVQQGRLREARELDDSARAVIATIPRAVLDTLYLEFPHGAALRSFSLAALGGDWRAHAATAPGVTRETIEAMPLHPLAWAEPILWYGFSAAARGDTAAARTAVRRIRAAAAAEPPGSLRTESAAIWTGELEGVLAWQAGDSATALLRLREAAAVDDTKSISGPPRWVPGSELLGQALLEFGRPREAAEAYRRTLDRLPRRPSALLGLARALRADGDSAGSATAYRELLEVWKDADADLLALSVPADAQAPAPAAHAGGSGTVPEVTLHYFPMIDQFCARLQKTQMDTVAVAEMTRRLEEFRAAWRANGPPLLRATVDVAGEPFRFREAAASLSACRQMGGGMSMPLIIGAYWYLDAATTGPGRTQEGMRRFTSSVFHEVLHRYVYEAITAGGREFTSPLLEKYAAEPPEVLHHLHLSALEALVYPRLGRGAELERLQRFEREHNKVPYLRAREIVAAEGAEAFVAELRQRQR